MKTQIEEGEAVKTLVKTVHYSYQRLLGPLSKTLLLKSLIVQMVTTYNFIIFKALGHEYKF